MNKEELKEATNFDTFLDCYKWLVKIGKENSPAIFTKERTVTKTVFNKPIQVKIPAYRIDIVIVKLEALKELFGLLPTQDQVINVISVIDDEMPRYMVQEAIELLQKIPTK